MITEYAPRILVAAFTNLFVHYGYLYIYFAIIFCRVASANSTDTSSASLLSTHLIKYSNSSLIANLNTDEFLPKSQQSKSSNKNFVVHGFKSSSANNTHIDTTEEAAIVRLLTTEENVNYATETNGSKSKNSSLLITDGDTTNVANMVLSVLFSLQNNILNVTTGSGANGTGGLLMMVSEASTSLLLDSLSRPQSSYYGDALPTQSTPAIGGEFIRYPSEVSARNFGAYASTSAEFLELDLIQNGTIFSNVSSSAVTKNQFIPVFEMVLGTVTYLVIIAMTVIGNILVIVAVFTYRPLKKVQNYFLVSLAASDLAVAIIVMPLHVVKFLADGRWLLGVTLCQIFTTADILLCTSSIWNLCAIAMDRYFAIHNPIDYAQKRTPKFVCTVIAVVWLVSLLISVPPLIGWNDWSSQKLMDHCELTTEKAFVVYSASGSFFVPLAVMCVVYVKIFISARQRIRTNRGRSALMKIGTYPPHNMSPGTSSECVAPRFTRLTPLVAATTTSVAHLLQRPTKVIKKDKTQPLTDPSPYKSKRSMSHAAGANWISSTLATRKKTVAKMRNARSNSYSTTLTVPPVTLVTIAAEKQQINHKSHNDSINTINSSTNSINNYCSIQHEQNNNNNIVMKNYCNNTIDLKVNNSNSLNHHSNCNNNHINSNNLLFVIASDGPSIFTQNGGESMLSDELTTTTSTTTSSTTKSCCDENRRPSTPIPPDQSMTINAQIKNVARFDFNRMPTKNGIVKDTGEGTISDGGGAVDEQLTATVLKNREKISVAKEKRAAKTIAVIIFVFTFCWMPFFCVYVILPFCDSCYLHPKVHQAVVWLGYINSSLNPFLYGILNLEFRRAFRKILCPKRFLNSRKKRSMLTVRR